MDVRHLFQLIKSAVQDFVHDQATVLAAAICYNTLFAITPLLLVLIAVLGSIYGSNAAASDQLLNRIGDFMGFESRQLAESLLKNAAKNGFTGSLIGISMTIIGATGLFNQIKFALNQVWNVRPIKGLFWRTIKTRVLSFLLVLIIAALLIVMLGISTVISSLAGAINRELSVPAWIFTGTDFLLSIGLITIMFALVYKWLPDAQIDWRESWTGAGITSVLFALGKIGLGFYLAHAPGIGVYGAAGSLVIVLIWVYYSSAIFLLGAELTQCHAEMYGKPIIPAPWSERTTPILTKKSPESLKARLGQSAA
jgi:membrane protein